MFLSTLCFLCVGAIFPNQPPSFGERSQLPTLAFSFLQNECVNQRFNEEIDNESWFIVNNTNCISNGYYKNSANGINMGNLTLINPMPF